MIDDQRFDRLARILGARHSRRQALTALGAAAAIVAIPSGQAAAGAPCVLTCPIGVDAVTSEGVCTAPVKLPEPTTTGVCGASPEIICLPSQIDFPVGGTQIICSIAEPAVTCSYNVFVYDVNEETLTCPADIVMSSDNPMAVSFDLPNLSTICTDYGTAGTTCDHLSGEEFSLGTTTVNCQWPMGKGGQWECSFNVMLVPTPPTATPTDVPPTETEVPPTTVPGEPTATEIPATEAPTTVPGDPTATTAPVTELPNTGSGAGGSGTGKVLPIAVAAAGAALIARLGLRKSAET